MALITTGTSILLLVYGLLESSKNLGLKAHEYDECALKVSRLYNKLRYAKEFENDILYYDLKRTIVSETTFTGKKDEKFLFCFEDKEL